MIGPDGLPHADLFVINPDGGKTEAPLTIVRRANNKPAKERKS